MSRVRFGDVAREVRKSCREVSGLRVVGLEHLEPENVTLEQWSESNDNTFSKLFSKGQVLFGRRRAYLKKAALATFDGVCSGDITVIEAIPDALEADLLPFIVQNDAFFDFAVGGSAGSLSPRVKWEHLSQYEFELPTFEEQKKLAQVLWAMERTKRAYKELLNQSAALAKSRFVEMFESSSFPIVQIANLAERVTKGTTPTSLGYKFESTGVNFVKVESFSEDGRLIKTKVAHISEECHHALARSQLKANDVLFSIAGAIGRVAIVDSDILPANTNQALAIIRLKKDSPLDLRYFMAVLKSQSVILQYESLKQGAAQLNVSLKNVSEFKIPLPPLALQIKYGAFIEQLDKSAFALKETLAKLTAAQKALMNQVFEK